MIYRKNSFLDGGALCKADTSDPSVLRQHPLEGVFCLNEAIFLLLDDGGDEPEHLGGHGNDASC